MAIDIGRIAYQAYTNKIKTTHRASAVDYLYWEDLFQEEQDAWRTAAVAVLQYIDDEKERMEKDPDIVG